MPVCKLCEEDQPRENFAVVVYHGKRRYSFCRPCWQIKYRGSIKRRATIAVASAARRAKKKGLPFDLDQQWMVEKLENGVCELSGAKFELNSTQLEPSPRAPSIDRIVPCRGYTRNNCRVIAVSLNYLLGSWGEGAALEVVLQYLKNRRIQVEETERLEA